MFQLSILCPDSDRIALYVVEQGASEKTRITALQNYGSLNGICCYLTSDYQTNYTWQTHISCSEQLIKNTLRKLV